MATHSSSLAWEIPWREECGGLESMGSQSDTTKHACTRALLEYECFLSSFHSSVFYLYNNKLPFTKGKWVLL